MSFKDFIKTNYFRFIYINILSVISGAAAIGAGYVQMYFLTDVKNKDWRGILTSVLLMGLLYIGTQGMIYYIQFEFKKKNIINRSAINLLVITSWIKETIKLLMYKIE